MDPQIETLEARHAMGVRRHVTIQEIGVRIGEMIGEVMAVAGPHCAGPVISRWHTWEDDQGEMELLVPVAAPMEGADPVEPSTLPGGKALTLTHVGPYDCLHESWTALKAWMAEQGVVGRDAPWEEYLDDPGVVPAAELRTKIVWPIE